MRTTICFAIAGVMLAVSSALSQAEQAPASGGSVARSPVSVRLPAAVVAEADSPKPPAGATRKTSIGKGKTATINTSNTAGDDDSAWVEDIDVDGDGNVESTDVLWDDEDKVLFFYADGDFACQGSGRGSGDLLIAVNGRGNARGRAAGSGWYLVTLDEGECKAEKDEAYGCKFDLKGNPTACGVAVLDEKNDDLVIATAAK